MTEEEEGAEGTPAQEATMTQAEIDSRLAALQEEVEETSRALAEERKRDLEKLASEAKAEGFTPIELRAKEEEYLRQAAVSENKKTAERAGKVLTQFLSGRTFFPLRNKFLWWNQGRSSPPKREMDIRMELARKKMGQSSRYAFRDPRSLETALKVGLPETHRRWAKSLAYALVNYASRQKSLSEVAVFVDQAICNIYDLGKLSGSEVGDRIMSGLLETIDFATGGPRTKQEVQS
jgi:hypothetical protein